MSNIPMCYYLFVTDAFSVHDGSLVDLLNLNDEDYDYDAAAVVPDHDCDCY